MENLEQELLSKYFEPVIKKISDLFFYPEIRDEAALRKHEAETAALAKSNATARNNSQEDLVSALAKHMHIVFAAFMELKTRFNQDDLTRAFTNRVITGSYQAKVKDKKSGKEEDETRKLGWPSICKDKNKDFIIAKISDAVVDVVKTLQTKSEQNLYSKTEKFKSVESSKNPSSHVSSSRESIGEKRNSASESEEEKGDSLVRSEQLQQQVISGISDDDFMKELARRMGEELTKTDLLEAVQREIEGNKVLDEEELLENLSDLKRDFINLRSRSTNVEKDYFLRRLSEEISLAPIPDLSAINPKDNTHYPEIIEAIHSKISTKDEIRLQEFHKIIIEEFQKDHQSSRSKVREGAAR